MPFNIDDDLMEEVRTNFKAAKVPAPPVLEGICLLMNSFKIKSNAYTIYQKSHTNIILILSHTKNVM